MSRFFLEPEQWAGEAWLEGDEARHLGQVLRGRAGDEVCVFDGRGRRALAEVLEVERGRVRLRLGEAVVAPPLRPTVTLVQAIPKGKTMDLIVQKAVELGVGRVQPLLTRNTVSRPAGQKVEKWRRVALEACKQCGQDLLPELAEPLAMTEWLERVGAEDGGGRLRVVASLAPGARPLRQLLRAVELPDAVELLVGPEGDFEAEEVEAAVAAGFLPATLGRIVLRVETASLFCLSAVRYEFFCGG